MNRNGRDRWDAVYHQSNPILTRIILFIVAVAFFVVPYAMLINSGVSFFQFGSVLSWIIVGVAVIIGVVLFIAAVFISSWMYRFDPVSRQMTMHASGILRISYSIAYSFDELGPPHVRIDSKSGRPPVYCVEIPVKGRYRHSYGVAMFQTEQSAIAEADRLRALLKA